MDTLCTYMERTYYVDRLLATPRGVYGEYSWGARQLPIRVSLCEVVSRSRAWRAGVFHRLGQRQQRSCHLIQRTAGLSELVITTQVSLLMDICQSRSNRLAFELSLYPVPG